MLMALLIVQPTTRDARRTRIMPILPTVADQRQAAEQLEGDTLEWEHRSSDPEGYEGSVQIALGREAVYQIKTCSVDNTEHLTNDERLVALARRLRAEALTQVSPGESWNPADWLPADAEIMDAFAEENPVTDAGGIAAWHAYSEPWARDTADVSAAVTELFDAAKATAELLDSLVNLPDCDAMRARLERALERYRRATSPA